MSVARVSNDVFKIGLPGRNVCYLVKQESYYVLVNSTSGELLTDVIRSILEVIHDKQKLKYVILTNCQRDSAGGACGIHKFFGAGIVIHYPDSVGIKHGTCGKDRIEGCEIYMELRRDVERIGDLEVIWTKSPTRGSVIALFRDFAFVGNDRLSFLGENIKMICDNIDCWRTDGLRGGL
jgi:glyoxylase-like metal-dependent hydrolase (beta-lactamase superfamily II)